MREYLEIIIYSSATLLGFYVSYYLNVKNKKDLEETADKLFSEDDDLEKELYLNEDDYRILPQEISENLKCVITLNVMRNPVICKYGFSYEKQDIINWVKSNNTSPHNRKVLTLRGLRPNLTLKKLIKYEIFKIKYKRLFN